MKILLKISIVLIWVVLITYGIYISISLNRKSSLEKEVINFPSGYEIGTWLWKSPDEISVTERNEIMAFLSREKISTIYLDISKVISILESTDASTKGESLKEFNLSTSKFIQKAKEAGLSVHALSGNTNWANSSHKYIPVLIVDYVLDFNKMYPAASFDGIQFDIEFYNETDYAKNIPQYVSNYLLLVRELVKTIENYNRQNDENFRFGLAIPFWLDTQQGGNIFNTLANELKQGKNNYLVIMAYRNYQSGFDGVVNLVKGEVDYIENNAPNVSLLIAQETDIGESSKTSFYGKSKQELKDAFINIAGYFKDSQCVGGLAIHHFYSYKNLREY